MTTAAQADDEFWPTTEAPAPTAGVPHGTDLAGGADVWFDPMAARFGPDSERGQSR